MGHFSKKYTHTLESIPTIVTLYQRMINTSSGDVTVGGTLTSAGSDQLSVLFYQDLHNFIESISDFPYTTEFVNDEDVSYSKSSSATSSVFKIGSMSYIPYISTMPSNATVANQRYIPWISIDPISYRKGTDGSASIRRDSVASGTKTGTTFRNIANCRKSDSNYDYEWTLHCYYNTHFCIIGFTNENTDKMICLLTQVDAVDRTGKGWYFITSVPGLSFVDGSSSINLPYGLIEFHMISDPVRIPGSSASGIIQSNGAGGIIPYGPVSYTTVGDVYSIKGNNTNASATDNLFDNPCITVSNSYAAGKTINIDSSPAIFSEDFIDVEDVIVSRPIVLRGLMSLTDQVLCASDNIVLNKEYEINGKKYYCPGDPGVTSLNMPFLFEFGLVS